MVESGRNIDDLPTRNHPLPFPVADTAPFTHLTDAIAFYQENIYPLIRSLWMNYNPIGANYTVLS